MKFCKMPLFQTSKLPLGFLINNQINQIYELQIIFL